MEIDMTTNEIPVRAASAREPAHPSITPEQISRLVETFYQRVQNDVRLAPIFLQQIPGDWGPHLEVMKRFWRSVLLKTGEYGGRPVPVHAKVANQTDGGLTKADFIAWLALFRQTVGEIFEPGAQPIVIEAAERIASSLWLATNGDLVATPPDWPSQQMPS